MFFSSTQIKQFIYKAVESQSFRDPAAIKLSWETRKKHLKALGAGEAKLLDMGQTGIDSLLRGKNYCSSAI